MMKKNCFQQDHPDNLIGGLLGAFAIPSLFNWLIHTIAWEWDLTVKTPLRIVISSVAFAIGCAWLIWFWFFDPFEEEAQ